MELLRKGPRCLQRTYKNAQAALQALPCDFFYKGKFSVNEKTGQVVFHDENGSDLQVTSGTDEISFNICSICCTGIIPEDKFGTFQRIACQLKKGAGRCSKSKMRQQC